MKKCTIMILLAAIVAVSCNKYELLDGCTYRNEIGASKPISLKIGHQKQTAFLAKAEYFLPEGVRIHVKAMHDSTLVRINGKSILLKRKGDEVWYITKAENYTHRELPEPYFGLPPSYWEKNPKVENSFGG